MRATIAALLSLVFIGAVHAVEIPAVAYHDIVPVRNGDPYAITVAEFEQQLAYLKRKGYEPISLKRLDAARRGIEPLPPKPILLTFDDALRSFDVYARPRLERHGYAAIVSVVTRWADAGLAASDAPNSAPMSWDELRRLARSPSIEFASHSNDLHRGIASDRHGTLTAAATSREFDATRGLESEPARTKRVSDDLMRSAARIKTELGVSPSAIAWPYGEYDAALIAAAAAAGMTYHLTLDDAPTTLARLPQINRFTLRDYRGLADFTRALAFHGHYRRDQRFVEVNFEIFAGVSPDETGRLLARTLERLRLLRVNAVVLHPFNADATRSFFATDALPVENDLALRVTMAILRRTGVQRIYLRLPRRTTADNVVLVRDFARRHPVHGVLVDGEIDAANVNELRDIMASYRPGAQVLVPERLANAAAGAVWTEIDANAPATAWRAAAQRFDPATTLYVIRNDGSDAQALRAVMTALRASGARHYGYAADALVANRPDARLIVAPLHAHTIAVHAP